MTRTSTYTLLQSVHSGADRHHPLRRYLSESIQKFYPQAKFSQMIEEAGFAVPKREPWEDLTFGVAAIHTGVKV